jgi:hypothetical protein
VVTSVGLGLWGPFGVPHVLLWWLAMTLGYPKRDLPCGNLKAVVTQLVTRNVRGGGVQRTSPCEEDRVVVLCGSLPPTSGSLTGGPLHPATITDRFHELRSRPLQEGRVVVLVARRQVLVAYNKQTRLLPEELQRRECALVEIGRQHARNFDAGHFASGGAAQRVLTELRKLAKRMASLAATPVRSGVLDALRARRAARLADAALPLTTTTTSAPPEEDPR